MFLGRGVKATRRRWLRMPGSCGSRWAGNRAIPICERLSSTPGISQSRFHESHGIVQRGRNPSGTPAWLRVKCRQTRRFLQKSFPMGKEQRFRWDKALTMAEEIEDEELSRKLIDE